MITSGIRKLLFAALLIAAGLLLTFGVVNQRARPAQPSSVFSLQAPPFVNVARAEASLLYAGGANKTETAPVVSTWTQRTPAIHPSARKNHKMVYDSARGVSVLFGGDDGAQLRSDTWEWNGAAWSQRTSSNNPPARYYHAMAYDSARQVSVLFGGRGNNDTILGDTWEWDGTTWTQRFPPASPPARWIHAMAYDSQRGVVVLFGGSGACGGACNDTWEWNGTTWSQRTPSTKPPVRWGHSMAYDSSRGVTVMFGGYYSGPRGDTWEWDGTTWTQRFPSSSPSNRETSSLAYDSGRGVSILFGGHAGQTFLHDTWEWNGTVWVDTSPSTGPSARDSHAMVYDSLRGVTVMFGGNMTEWPFVRLADTWEYRAQGCNIWNLASDFRISPNQENPNSDSCGNSDIWHFMRSSDLNRDPLNYSLLPNFGPDLFDVLGLESWQGTHADQRWLNTRYPYVGINATGRTYTQSHSVGTLTWLTDTVHIHPYLTELAVIGWRSTFTGTISITGTVSDAEICIPATDDDGILWYIDKGVTNLAYGSIGRGGIQAFQDGNGGITLNNIAVNPGEIIYFVIHPNGDHYCDVTSLDISIIRSSTRVRVSPADKRVFLGSGEFTVDIMVEDITNLAAYQAQLTYDPAIVQVTAVTQGPFLGSTGRTVVPVGPSISNTVGIVTFGAFSFGTPPGASDTGVLATITFQPQAAGTSALHLQNLQLADPNGNLIPANTQDGQVRLITCFGDCDGDGDVDIIDLQRAASQWNCRRGDACYDELYDVQPDIPDGDIDIFDIQRLANAWGTTCPITLIVQDTAAADATLGPMNAGLSLLPTGLHVTPGSLFTLTVRTQDATNVGAFQTDVVYDPAVVRAEGVAIGPFLGSTGRTVIPVGPDIDNTTGRVVFGAFTFGSQSGASGSGDLAYIVFRAQTPGQTTLNFENTGVSDPQGNPLVIGNLEGSSAVVRFRTYLPLIMKNYP